MSIFEPEASISVKIGAAHDMFEAGIGLWFNHCDCGFPEISAHTIVKAER